MIGFVGQRRVQEYQNGIVEQLIECSSTNPAITQQQVAFWKAIFPDGQDPNVQWESEMVLRLGGHRLIMQRVEERSEWRKTFVQGLVPNARWITPTCLRLSSDIPATPPTTTSKEKPEFQEGNLDVLTDAQLRTYAIEHGIAVDPSEPPAVTRTKILEYMTAPVG